MIMTNYLNNLKKTIFCYSIVLNENIIFSADFFNIEAQKRNFEDSIKKYYGKIKNEYHTTNNVIKLIEEKNLEDIKNDLQKKRLHLNKR